MFCRTVSHGKTPYSWKMTPRSGPGPSIGLPSSRTLPETQNVVGYLNTTLVQRGDFSGDPSFAQLLARVRASAVGAYDHQDMPLEKLVLTLREGKERLSHAPLFEVVLTMQDTGGASMSLADVAVESYGIDFGATKFDITLLVSERGDEVGLTAQYRTDLFAPDTMRRFLGHVLQMLDSAAANPAARVSELPLLTPAERAELTAWNDTAADLGWCVSGRSEADLGVNDGGAHPFCRRPCCRRGGGRPHRSGPGWSRRLRRPTSSSTANRS